MQLKNLRWKKLNLKTNQNIGIFSILFLLSLIVFPLHAFAYDFSDVRVSMARDLEKWQGYAAKNKIAIVYNNEQRPQIKTKYNLVRIKKDLSYELLKNFDIADPIIVQEILKNNNIQFAQITNNKAILEQFADRADCSQVLLVDFSPKANTLVIDIRLMNKDNMQISRIVTEIVPEEPEKVTYQSAPAVSDTSGSDTSFFKAFNFDFGSREFDTDQNDSWIFFRPTALINPKSQSLDLNLWFKDLSNVDIQITRFRYDLTLLELLQFGVQSYAIADKKSSVAGKANLAREFGHHSTYASLKYQLVGEKVMPVSLAIGIRSRLLWDANNTDFRSRDEVEGDMNSNAYLEAQERDEQHDRYDRLTMQAMISGKIPAIGILYNLYLDSLTFGSGIKFLLTSDIKLFADNIYYYYEDPDIVNDTAFGIQFYNPYGSTDISYQVETERFHLGINLDF
ncbi:hypothetical protein KJ966_27340 [bacterium]|nr:hypothetical protein [bacterium]